MAFHFLFFVVRRPSVGRPYDIISVWYSLRDVVTPREWLAQPLDFGKTRFRRLPTFHFSTPEIFSLGFVHETQQFSNVFSIILKSCTFLSVSGICSMKNYTILTKYHPCATPKVVSSVLLSPRTEPPSYALHFVHSFLHLGVPPEGLPQGWPGSWPRSWSRSWPRSSKRGNVD